MQIQPIAVIVLMASPLVMAVLDCPLAAWTARHRLLEPAAAVSALLSAIVPLAVLAAGGIVVAGIVRKALRRPGIAAEEATRAAWFVLLSTLGAGLASWPLKYAIGRSRPLLSGRCEPFDFEPFAAGLSAGFPSTQAAMAGGLATSLALLNPSWRPAAISVAVAIGGARVLAGAHWASDVVLGWGLGAVAAVFLAGRLAVSGGRWGWPRS